MDERYDIRDRGPSRDYRAAFLAGWTDAVKGQLYETTVSTKKTHANMGNLFGWIYGEQDREFRLETWYRYLSRSLDKSETATPLEEDPLIAMAGVDDFEPPSVAEVAGADRTLGTATDIGHVNPKRQRVIRRVGPSP
ncbi:MAG: hypothetical protein V3T72_02315, partial [Thermoanaerobaculia bacterium]